MLWKLRSNGSIWFFIPLVLATSLACNAASSIVGLDTTDIDSAGESGEMAGPINGAVGVDGGEIAGPGGVRLIFPDGAVPGDVEVSIAQVESPLERPENALSAGPAYEVNMPPGTDLMFPVEMVLPLERQPDLGDENYAAYRWDGEKWYFLGGIVDEDHLRVQVDEFSIIQIYGFSTTHRPVAVVNWSGNKVWVFPWTWRTGEFQRFSHAFTFTAKPGGDIWPGATWASQSYPLGEYYTWCIQWDEWTVPVWDLGGGGYWSEYIGTYHMFLEYPITLTKESAGGGLLAMTRVEFTLTGEILDGICGMPPGEIPETPALTPAVPASPSDTPGPQTPAGGPTPTASAQAVAPTSSPTPSPTLPPASATATPTVTRSTTGTSSRVLGGNARNFSRPPDFTVSANTEEKGPPPPGIEISYSQGTTPWIENRILWSEGDWVQASTSLDYSAMGVQILGDSTIGWAAVYFDDQEVWRGNATQVWQDADDYVHALYVEVSGFEPGLHTIKVVCLGIDGGGGGQSVPVPYFGFNEDSVVTP